MLDAPPSLLRLALVSEDPLARGALARALSDQGEGWTVVAAGTQVELEAARGAPPDVVLWDTGLRLTEGAAPDLGAPVLALVADEAAGELALGEGARGLLFRDVAPGMLVAALHAVARGLTVFEPGLSHVRAAPRNTAPSGLPGATGPDTLTPREREVLGLLAEGLSNKAIADRLAISDHTAKFHVNAVLAKLGVQRRTEAVVRAARLGLVTL
ncbi:response regulator transcription factor [Corallococcus llansteffanensis]|uniref:DNA-binding response regulator n=1 Tax=Corallococcus llansteffanensis TaxID=2316731 RepID=A0A3A8PET7_9BACT|nr:response regulator transcription factor [Corallococcus llansteffanensis]RKH52075.1 DNA-binding response regulator [Corallococcus llansteffanensis]